MLKRKKKKDNKKAIKMPVQATVVREIKANIFIGGRVAMRLVRRINITELVSVKSAATEVRKKE